ncbi:uncharacterized protein B0I36DRAFT_350584 [Microdochium trichocladiopsis]|uniref:FluG domain-containing protein n=1 Tax=Microdochium trichocladiopsis TaxID=1682393 RepID=A0A9P8Y5M6_9PEZI|nr:uncharacterized protein B0I36DRAFT_350584 [Microdochium trichocladiopsis]KAH7029765.1 hypothetical protein B0I36DRAFT_350584 [Microdochium trichocladiopsis]
MTITYAAKNSLSLSAWEGTGAISGSKGSWTSSSFLPILKQDPTETTPVGPKSILHNRTIRCRVNLNGKISKIVRMGKKKSPDDYYRIAKERGADQCWTGINNDVTYGSLSKGEESTEKRILSMWKGYKERYPEAHERHLLHLKSFMREVAMGIEGMRCDLGVERRPGLEDHPAESTVVHYWKTFTRTFYRADDPLGPKITLSVRRVRVKIVPTFTLNSSTDTGRFTQYIQTDLQKDFPMPKVKRPRRFGTLTHYGHLAAQQWGADWHIYSDSSVRVYDWAGLNAHVTSSSRIGEYFESTCRPGTERGLHFRGIEDEPFYPSAFSKGVERAGPISRRIRELGIRAGYAEPPRPHDFRAGSLLRVYGQGAYFTGSSRTDVLELFQDLTIRRNPFMLQALSAQARAEFEDSKEIKDLRGELHTIKHGNANNQGSKKRRAELYHKRRRLEIEACRKLQEQQASTFAEATTERCYYRSYFDRVRYLMPERDRLAKNLFQSAQLRESLGRSALTDLIALCTQKREVQYRPGLEPDKCNCKRSQEDYDWKHIHDCYKKQQSAPTTFCFMCHQWIAGKDEWKGHCLSHLERSDTIPKFCDPLTHAVIHTVRGKRHSPRYKSSFITSRILMAVA